MLRFTRHHRDTYLHALAVEPLLRGVPKHLIPVVGRSLDIVHLAEGSTLMCTPARETIIVIEGQALRQDSEHRPVALVGPGDVIGDPGATCGATEWITTVTGLRCFVVARRELPALLRIAPGVVDAIARARSIPVVGQLPSVLTKPATSSTLPVKSVSLLLERFAMSGPTSSGSNQPPRVESGANSSVVVRARVPRDRANGSYAKRATKSTGAPTRAETARSRRRRRPRGTSPLPSAGELSDLVQRATHTIAAQANCYSIEALTLLVARADELGRSLHFTATDVLDGFIRFDS